MGFCNNIFFLLLCCTVVVVIHGTSHEENEASDSFVRYMKQFNKKYRMDSEFDIRFKNFKTNLGKIKAHNEAGNKPYTLNLTSLSDMSWDEFKNSYLMQNQDCSATLLNSKMDILPFSKTHKSIPPAFDWRSRGVVTDVKDQGNCGSCWTFSTTGCLESHHAIATGKLVGLSEQNLVDCAGAYNNNGCDGGLPSQAFEYIYYNGGIDTEDSYPYQGEDGNCQYSPNNIGAKVSSIVNITQGDENDILDAVANVGPVSICFDVVDDFMNYDGGVYSSTDCGNGPNDVNHAVLVVGYNVTYDGSNTPYWIVKNSWGDSWGLNGYFWIERNANMCGLADCASYPICYGQKPKK